MLGIPCFALRDNTERPVTITEGTNQLVLDMSAIPDKLSMSVALAKGGPGVRP